MVPLLCSFMFLLLLNYLDSDTPVLPKPPSPATPQHADKHRAVGKGLGAPCRDGAVAVHRVLNSAAAVCS